MPIIMTTEWVFSKHCIKPKTPPRVIFSSKPFRGIKIDSISSTWVGQFTTENDINAYAPVLLTFNTSVGTEVRSCHRDILL